MIPLTFRVLHIQLHGDVFCHTGFRIDVAVVDHALLGIYLTGLLCVIVSLFKGHTLDAGELEHIHLAGVLIPVRQLDGVGGHGVVSIYTQRLIGIQRNKFNFKLGNPNRIQRDHGICGGMGLVGVDCHGVGVKVKLTGVSISHITVAVGGGGAMLVPTCQNQVAIGNAEIATLIACRIQQLQIDLTIGVRLHTGNIEGVHHNAGGTYEKAAIGIELDADVMTGSIILVVSSGIATAGSCKEQRRQKHKGNQK